MRKKKINKQFFFCLLLQYIGGGFAGLQGIIYAGTNCFHRRNVIYGLSPDHDIQNAKKDNHAFTNGT